MTLVLRPHATDRIRLCLCLWPLPLPLPLVLLGCLRTKSSRRGYVMKLRASWAQL
ncbi:uncharacterized protein LY89DRAFT_686799 [Mollisia scopiformis]|uniref:Uncharacterized protein n=1 Tax=Mollisia scopiformis TaxID=149040 RepID=A0A194X2R5_MOLSC|nr:uncharacterized protein LY89DRAFT_686799 [Mollisia scopiformis]KUJ14314.1 hypothetical protein LY89DRAFT_686799 [Mollisia scopiformis]